MQSLSSSALSSETVGRVGVKTARTNATASIVAFIDFPDRLQPESAGPPLVRLPNNIGEDCGASNRIEQSQAALKPVRMADPQQEIFDWEPHVSPWHRPLDKPRDCVFNGRKAPTLAPVTTREDRRVVTGHKRRHRPEPSFTAAPQLRTPPSVRRYQRSGSATCLLSALSSGASKRHARLSSRRRHIITSLSYDGALLYGTRFYRGPSRRS
jgi:hypothetical protein